MSPTRIRTRQYQPNTEDRHAVSVSKPNYEKAGGLRRGYPLVYPRFVIGSSMPGKGFIINWSFKEPGDRSFNWRN